MATRTQTLALAKLRDKAAAQPGAQADNQGQPDRDQAQGAVVQLHSTQPEASSVPTIASALPSVPASSPAADLRQEEIRQDDNRQPGRPPADTTQISLRLPRKWEAILRRRAAEASVAPIGDPGVECDAQI